jgi:type IV secretion system protein TrbE
MRRASFDPIGEYREAGAANALFAPWTFVDESLFLTHTRALGAVFQIAGVDYECLDPGEREIVVSRWKAALRLWTEEHRLYQYLLKSRQAPIPAELPGHPVARQAVQERLAWFEAHQNELYTYELFVVVLYEGWSSTWPQGLAELARHPAATLRSWIEMPRAATILDEELTLAVGRFRHHLYAWQRQLEDALRPVLLKAADAYDVLWRVINHGSSTPPPRFRPEVPLDESLLEGDLEAFRAHLRAGRRLTRVITMRRPPGETWAHQLESLYRVPAIFVLCTEWRRESTFTSRRHIQSMRRHFHAAKVSLLTYIQNRDPERHEVLVDDSADSMVDVLGEALTALDIDDQYYGWFALSVVVVADSERELDRTCAEVLKAFGDIDAVAGEETYNGLAAWCAVVPGNTRDQLRSMRLLNTNAADLALLFTLHTGETRNVFLDREYLAVLETSHSSSYFLNLHYHDVGHAVVLGATGSGKSFLLNFLVTHVMKYQPRVMIFDIGGSYAKLTDWFAGSYLRLTLEPRDVTINPFSLEPTRANLHFLTSFVRVLLGPERQQLSLREEHEIYEQVANIYSLDPSLRRLATLADMLPRSLERPLQRWLRDGPYAALFDHATDTVTFNEFQCFDLTGLERYEAVMGPLFFYLLHRANADVHDPMRAAQLKVCVVEEAWKVLQNPIMVSFLQDALKTWRKLRASMWLVTQAAEDFVESKLLRTVIESCPTRLFLANPGMDLAAYRDLFNLNETESRHVRDLVPRQQILVKRPDRAKLLTLRVDPRSLSLYSPNPPREMDGTETTVDPMSRVHPQ